MLNKLTNNNIYRAKIVNSIVKLVDSEESGGVKIETNNVEDSTIINLVTISLKKSFEYSELVEKRTRLEKELLSTSENDTDKRLKLSAEIEHQKALNKQYVEDSLNFAWEVTNVPIVTDRVKRAAAHFENGRIQDARDIFELEKMQMLDEKTRLLQDKEYALKVAERLETETLPKLNHIASDFLSSALIAQINISDSSAFEKISLDFQNSIEAFPGKSNLLAYANFLQKNNQYTEAEKYFQKCLDEYSEELDLWDKASINNGLGSLQLDNNEFEPALNSFNQSLTIWENLIEKDTDEYTLDLIATLNSLGETYDRLGDFDLSLKNYDRALKLAEKSSETNPTEYLPYVLSTLNNLGNLYNNFENYDEAISIYEKALEDLHEFDKRTLPTYLSDQAKLFYNLANAYFFKSNIEKDVSLLERALNLDQSALEIRQDLAKNEPLRFMPEVAESFYHLGEINTAFGRKDQAVEYCNKALELFIKLADFYPQVYSPKIAKVFKFLSIFYQKISPDFQKSVNYAVAAIKLLMPIHQLSAEFEDNCQTCLNVLSDWLFSDSEIQELISN